MAYKSHKQLVSFFDKCFSTSQTALEPAAADGVKLRLSWCDPYTPPDSGIACSWKNCDTAEGDTTDVTRRTSGVEPSRVNNPFERYHA